jgi:hypothetical protein
MESFLKLETKVSRSKKRTASSPEANTALPKSEPCDRSADVPATDAPRRAPDIRIEVKAVAVAEAKKGPSHRPTSYTPEIAERVCEAISEGMSVREIANTPDFPRYTTLRRWIRKYPEFAEEYAAAEEWKLRSFEDDILDIAFQREPDKETGKIDRSCAPKAQDLPSGKVAHIGIMTTKLEQRLAREKPKKYGDVLQIGGPNEIIPPGSSAGDGARLINPDAPAINDPENDPMARSFEAWRKTVVEQTQ